MSQSVTQLQTADFKLLHIHVEPSPPAFFRRHICLISRSKFCYYDCVKEFLITRIYKHVSWGNPSCSCSGQGFADSRYHQGIIMAKSLSFFSDSILSSLLNFLMWRCSLPSANLRIWKKPESCQVHRKQVGRKKQRDFLSSSAFFVTTAVKITLL